MMLRWSRKPFRTMGFINSFVGAYFAVILLTGVADRSSLSNKLDDQHTLELWSVLLLLAVVIEWFGFRRRSRIMVETSTEIFSLCWLYAGWIFALSGDLFEAIPYLFAPLALSVYMRIKVYLDDSWYLR